MITLPERVNQMTHLNKIEFALQTCSSERLDLFGDMFLVASLSQNPDVHRDERHAQKVNASASRDLRSFNFGFLFFLLEFQLFEVGRARHDVRRSFLADEKSVFRTKTNQFILILNFVD